MYIGIRLLGLVVTDITEASALGHMTDKIHIFSNSWGPSDDGGSAEQPGELLSQVLETAARTVRSDVLHAIKYSSLPVLCIGINHDCMHVLIGTRSCEKCLRGGIYTMTLI